MMEYVEFETTDGVLLRGEQTRGGDDWLILVHEAGRDLDDWRDLVPLLARIPLTLLSFDLRGHGGSDGEPSPEAIGADIEAASAFAAASGAASLLVAAAGRSVGPALDAAHRAGAQGFVAIGPGSAPHRAMSLARLLVVASRDPDQCRVSRALHAGGGWAVTVHVPTNAHAGELMTGEWRAAIGGHVLGFLRDRLRGREYASGAGR